MGFSSAIRSGILALAGMTAAFAAPQPAFADPLAKEAFGSQRLPAATNAAVHGTYSKGCFSGGVAIAADGPTWQAMRLSRNRRWGHPEMISLLERFSREAVQDGWPGLLLGDVSQPRGGPMLSGHASHQLGLDADVWFQPMPTGGRLTPAQREKKEFVSLLGKNSLHVDERKWTPAHAAILKRAASYPNVERVLVHPGIKKKLCDTVRGDRSWLGKVRPIWGHDSHFHIRIGCPAGSNGCKQQEAIPAGDGCDKSLAWWFTDEPWRGSDGPAPVRARDVMKLSALPAACRAVLSAPAPASEAVVTVTGRGTPMLASTSSALPTAASAYAPTPDAAIPLPQPRPYN